LGETIIQHYESLSDIKDKISFVQDLKISAINETLLSHMNEGNFKVLLSVVFKLCTSKNT
jgi:hypothetical protein